jgi:hypothetical protein
MLEEVNLHLDGRSVRITTDAMMDGVMIDELSSTRTQAVRLTPTHQPRKGGMWHFRLKSYPGDGQQQDSVGASGAISGSLRSTRALGCR